MTTHSHKAVLMVAHGARAAGWDAPFQRILQALQTTPGSEVHYALAFLEHKEPSVTISVAELVERGCTHITLVPMLLGVGMHAREDLPRHKTEAEATHPQVQFVLSATLGEDGGMLDAMAGFVRAAG